MNVTPFLAQSVPKTVRWCREYTQLFLFLLVPSIIIVGVSNGLFDFKTSIKATGCSLFLGATFKYIKYFPYYEISSAIYIGRYRFRIQIRLQHQTNINYPTHNTNWGHTNFSLLTTNIVSWRLANNLMDWNFFLIKRFVRLYSVDKCWNVCLFFNTNVTSIQLFTFYTSFFNFNVHQAIRKNPNNHGTSMKTFHYTNKK